MARDVIHMRYDEFAAHLPDVFARVIRDQEVVVVETDEGVRAVLKPLRDQEKEAEDDAGVPAGLKPLRTTKLRTRPKTEADYEAMLAAAGSWKDVDTEKLKADIYESRRMSSRPPVEL